MDNVKKLFNQLSDIVDWFVEIWEQGLWDKRLLLIVSLLVGLGGMLKFSEWLNITQLRNDPNYATGWLVLIIFTLLLTVVVIILAINRKRRQREKPTFDPGESQAIKGLRAFGPGDADIFKELQREADLTRCYNIVNDTSFRFGILYGESGCGKSSFLHAGLFPAFAQTPAGENARCLAVYVKFTNTEPEKAIRAALLKQFELNQEQAELTQLLTAACDAYQCAALLIFDQFEQFFVHHPQKEQRAPFVQLLASWHEQLKTVKILLAIRSDHYFHTDEIQQALNYAPSLQEIFKLEKFNADQATAIFRVLAESNQLQYDEQFVKTLCQQELAKSDGLVSPIDIQILSWVVAGLNLEGRRGFTKTLFLKAGGVEGLLGSFLERTLELLVSDRKRNATIIVLLALIDKETNLRAGALDLSELQLRVPDLSAAEVSERLTWLTDNKVRLVTVLTQENETQYELCHEKLVPAIFKLANKQLGGFDRANQLLEKRVSEWLGSDKARRYLFSFPEWRLIEKEKSRIVWGPRKLDKLALLAASRRRWQWHAGALGVLLSLCGSAVLAWYSPQGQIFECQRYLDEYAGQAPDETLLASLNRWLGLEDRGAAETRSVMAGLQSLTLSHLDQFDTIEAVLAAKIVNPSLLSLAYQSLSRGSAQANHQERALDLLEKARSQADTITDFQQRAAAFNSLAETAAELGDPDQAAELLDQAQASASQLSETKEKAETFQSLAATAAGLGKPGEAKLLLQEAEAATEQFLNHNNNSALPENLLDQLELDGASKNYFYQELAKTAIQVGDTDRASSILEQAIIAAEQTKNARVKSDSYQSLVQIAAQLDDTDQLRGLLNRAKTAAEQVKNEKNKADSYRNLAEVLINLDDQTFVRNFLADLISAVQRLKEPKGQALVLTAAAQAFAALGDQNQAWEHLNQAISSAEQIDFEKFRADAYQQISQTAVKLGLEIKALDVFSQLAALAEQIGNPKRRTDTFIALTDAAAQLDNSGRIREYLNLAQAAARKIRMFRWRAESFCTLAELASRSGEHAQSKEFLVLAEKATAQIEDEKNQAELYLKLAHVAEELNDAGSALKWAELAVNSVNKAEHPDNMLPVFLFSAQLHARRGEFRQACYLASENKTVSADDAVQILTAVMREHALKNGL